MSGIYEISTLGQLEQHLNSDKLLLIDFWAPWCTSCKAMLPCLERIVTDSSKKLVLLKVNIDILEQAAERFTVLGLPCIILLQHKTEQLRITQLLTEGQLKKALSPWIELGYVQLLKQADVEADQTQALRIIEKAIELESDLSQVHLAYIKRLLQAEEGTGRLQAQNHIDNLSPEILRDPEISRIVSYLDLLNDITRAGEQFACIYSWLVDEQYTQAFDALITAYQHQSNAEIHELIVKLLNVMPDRKLAHRLRVQFLALA